MNHPDIVNTRRLDDSQSVSSFPAQACTEVGADQGDDRPGEGAGIALPLVVVLLIVLCALVAHIAAVLTA